MSVEGMKTCARCGYSPLVDATKPEEHAQQCGERASGVLDYTAAPNCSARMSHHHETWCDTCGGVA